MKNRCFTECQLSKDAVAKYKLESDNVGLFIEEQGYVKSIDQHEYLASLYSEYKAYCQLSGYHPCHKAELSARLDSLGYVSRRHKNGKVYFIAKPEYEYNENIPIILTNSMTLNDFDVSYNLTKQLEADPSKKEEIESLYFDESLSRITFNL